jgi:hypothetical protein
MRNVDLDAAENALVLDRGVIGDRKAWRAGFLMPKGSLRAVFRSARATAATRKRPVTLAGSPLSNVDSERE